MIFYNAHTSFRHQHGVLGGLCKWRRCEGFEQFRFCNLAWSHSGCPAQPFRILNDHLRHRCDGFRLLDRQVLGPLLVRDSYRPHVYMAAPVRFGLVY